MASNAFLCLVFAPGVHVDTSQPAFGQTSKVTVDQRGTLLYWEWDDLEVYDEALDCYLDPSWEKTEAVIELLAADYPRGRWFFVGETAMIALEDGGWDPNNFTGELKALTSAHKESASPAASDTPKQRIDWLTLASSARDRLRRYRAELLHQAFKVLLVAIALAFLAAIAASIYFFGIWQTFVGCSLLWIIGRLQEVFNQQGKPTVQEKLSRLPPGKHLVRFDYRKRQRLGVVTVEPLDYVAVVFAPEPGDSFYDFRRVKGNKFMEEDGYSPVEVDDGKSKRRTHHLNKCFGFSLFKAETVSGVVDVADL